MKIFCSAIILILATILLTGCGFKDIDKRIFISAIGIDPAEEGKGFKVTLKIALPVASVKDSSGPRYAYFSKEGETIGESLRVLETHMDKVLEFGHIKAIVINENLFTDDIQEYMNYFTRRGDIQLIAYIVAARPSAEEILKAEPVTEATSTISLFNFFDDTGTESPYITTCFLFQFRREYLSTGIDSFVPLMETNEDGSELHVNQAIVTGKGKEAVVLSHIQTKYYNSLFKGKTGLDYKVVDDDLTLMLDIDHVKMSYKIITENNKPVAVKMNVKMVGVIGQSSESISLHELDYYNEIASKEIKKKLMEFLTALQESNLDPGFGLRYRATRLHEKGLFEQWEEAYKDISFNVTVNVQLKSTGALE